jgi:hypothetical protein
MKKFLVFIASALLSVSAFAADPDLVSNVTGTKVLALGNAYGVVPVSVTGSHARVLYAGYTGWQNLEDDAIGSKYNYVKGRLIAKGAIEVGNAGSGIFYVPNKDSFVQCDSQGSYLQIGNTATMMRDYLAGDGCAYRDKVRANAN